MTVVKVRDPGRRPGELATFELRDLRRELQRALDILPEGHAGRPAYSERLAAIQAEAEARARAGHPVPP